jgi:hypothetical protein
MKEKTGCTRVRAPLGDADRLTISLAAKQCVRDEVLDVVIERLAVALGYGGAPASTPTLRLHPGAVAVDAGFEISTRADIKPGVNAWGGLVSGPAVRIMPREGSVLARIG